MSSTTRDQWAEWLAERRFGGDPEFRATVLEKLTRTRDSVLDRADLREGETLLDVCRQAATELGVLDRCRFVEASAENLGSIEDKSADVVTTRSVLIYVEEKAAAFGEFARVLRPGGRISLWEPINRFGSGERR